MRLRPAILVMCTLPLWTAAGHAQFPPAPGQPQQQQQAPACVQEFFKIREDAEKKAGAIKAAGDRKATPKEVCPLFNAFVAVQAKLLKFANENSVWCGIPPQVPDQIKQGLVKITEIRNRVCQAAAAPAQQAAPSLSDALSSPVPDSNNIKTGRGTFDTLTGNPLGK